MSCLLSSWQLSYCFVADGRVDNGLHGPGLLLLCLRSSDSLQSQGQKKQTKKTVWYLTYTCLLCGL